MEKNEEKKSLKRKLLPLTLCAFVVIFDQITKAIVAAISNPGDELWSCFGGFIKFTHQRNPGVAFSLGAGWHPMVNKFVFVVIPILVIAYVIKVCMRTDELTDLQRWSIFAIIGGGIGNLIDRVFRTSGVVDFIDVQWFGWHDCPLSFFRGDRFATFNVGDSFVVVFGIVLIVTFVINYAKQSKENKKNKKEK